MLENIFEVAFWYILIMIFVDLFCWFLGDKLYWYRKRRKISKLLMLIAKFQKEFENEKLEKLNQLGLTASEAGKTFKGFMNAYYKYMEGKNEKEKALRKRK